MLIPKPLISLFHLLPVQVQDTVTQALYTGKLQKMDVQSPDIIWVNPEDIQHRTSKYFHITECKGKVIGGNWDSLQVRFGSYDFYQAATLRFKHGVPWEETEFFHRVLRGGEYGDKKRIERRCRLWDKAYNSMKTDGYIAEICQDHIAVNIGRHGDLLFNNGGHRLAIAKILKLPLIPVEVTIRHRKWEDFRQEIAGYADKVYSPLMHPDLTYFPAVHGHERWEMIEKSLDTRLKSVLDIGSHWGYFCHRFEESGYDCTAVESSPIHLHFLTKLRRASNRQFTIESRSVLPMTIKADVVLALAVFHHFLKGDKMADLKAMLGRMQCKVMYFEPHREGESQMEKLDADEYKSPEQFVQWIIDNSCLTKAEKIGVTSDDRRPLYKLSGGL